MRADITEMIATRQDILARLRTILIERMHMRRAPEELDPDAALFGAGFGLDSLDAVELVVCLDASFGVRLKDDQLLRQQMRSLNTLVDLVIAHRDGHVAR
jgi:acyl carrier protein